MVLVKTIFKVGLIFLLNSRPIYTSTGDVALVRNREICFIKRFANDDTLYAFGNRHRFDSSINNIFLPDKNSWIFPFSFPVVGMVRENFFVSELFDDRYLFAVIRRGRYHHKIFFVDIKYAKLPLNLAELRENDPNLPGIASVLDEEIRNGCTCGEDDNTCVSFWRQFKKINNINYIFLGLNECCSNLVLKGFLFSYINNQELKILDSIDNYPDYRRDYESKLKNPFHKNENKNKKINSLEELAFKNFIYKAFGISRIAPDKREKLSEDEEKAIELLTQDFLSIDRKFRCQVSQNGFLQIKTESNNELVKKKNDVLTLRVPDCNDQWGERYCLNPRIIGNRHTLYCDGRLVTNPLASIFLIPCDKKDDKYGTADNIRRIFQYQFRFILCLGASHGMRYYSLLVHDAAKKNTSYKKREILDHDSFGGIGCYIKKYNKENKSYFSKECDWRAHFFDITTGEEKFFLDDIITVRFFDRFKFVAAGVKNEEFFISVYNFFDDQEPKLIKKIFSKNVNNVVSCQIDDRGEFIFVQNFDGKIFTRCLRKKVIQKNTIDNNKDTIRDIKSIVLDKSKIFSNLAAFFYFCYFFYTFFSLYRKILFKNRSFFKSTILSFLGS